MYEFTVNAMLRGYHVYQDMWEVNIGEILPCTREVGNHNDPQLSLFGKMGLRLDMFPAKFCVYAVFMR